MSNLGRTVSIDLGERSYPVHVGPGEVLRLGARLRERGLRGKVVIGTNPAIWRGYGPAVGAEMVTARQGQLAGRPVKRPSGNVH